MTDPAALVAILGRQLEADRAMLIGALAPMIARHVRRIERDAAIRAVAAARPTAGLSARGRAEAVEREMRRYAGSRWRIDRTMSGIPPAYVGTPKEPLFIALHACEGATPSLATVRRILARDGRSWLTTCR